MQIQLFVLSLWFMHSIRRAKINNVLGVYPWIELKGKKNWIVSLFCNPIDAATNTNQNVCLSTHTHRHAEFIFIKSFYLPPKSHTCFSQSRNEANDLFHIHSRNPIWLKRSIGDNWNWLTFPPNNYICVCPRRIVVNDVQSTWMYYLLGFRSIFK